MQSISIEMEARDMLHRMGVQDVNTYTAGDLVELAQLIADNKKLKKFKEQTPARPSLSELNDKVSIESYELEEMVIVKDMYDKDKSRLTLGRVIEIRYLVNMKYPIYCVRIGTQQLLCYPQELEKILPEKESLRDCLTDCHKTELKEHEKGWCRVRDKPVLKDKPECEADYEVLKMLKNRILDIWNQYGVKVYRVSVQWNAHYPAIKDIQALTEDRNSDIG